MFEFPEYVAVIESAPDGKVVVANVAFPPDNVAVPRTAVPSVKVTVPIGVVVADVTVAVSFTDWSTVEGFREDAKTVVVVAWSTT